MGVVAETTNVIATKSRESLYFFNVKWRMDNENLNICVTNI